MIELIYGKKGSGKTKRLLGMVNAEVETAKGDVVFIDDDKRYMYDVKREIRFVDTSEYGIEGVDRLYGLICGMLAQNFDITAIYIDAFLKIIGKKPEELEEFMDGIKKLHKDTGCKFIFIVSADEKEAPAFLKEYIV